MTKIILTLFLILTGLDGQKLLIPMDQAQNDHLKAYGIAYYILTRNVTVEWLLNYRGGSFLVDDHPFIQAECRIRGVSFIQITDEIIDIYTIIDQENMDIALLEKAPKIAIYTPLNKQPWDDAVTLALTYAEVRYETLWDEEVLSEKLFQYDWLHLHHEDFTGQYGKFYRNYHNAQWYIDQKMQFEIMAQKLGMPSVHEEKKAVSRAIKSYVGNGGFIFAMCSATDSYDIALSLENIDGVHQVFDGSPIDSKVQNKLDYSKSLAFTDFKLYSDPMIYEFSNIDFPPSHNPITRGAEADYFSLFEFSAKYDPVPTMLTQNHAAVVKGFMGQTTGFHRNRIKKHVVIMGEDPASEQVKYLHGNFGKGSFTFYGGHDPEDYQHFVGDPPTDLSLHRNSPGYRLILNNILFPAARKKERKT
ncbi:MAG TPA: asparagine synthetase B [Candidatus Marinimicrobia bacterium]|nr:asparagine synthetase B [Candidatus Neomarinimicrobiota bacterium]